MEKTSNNTNLWISQKWDYEADIVIVGYGGGGVSAAIEASDAGATVLVLEKAPEKYAGGNTACTGGFFLGRNVEAAIEYTRSECWGTVPDDEVIRAHVLACHELPAWIEHLGAKLGWAGGKAAYPLIPGGDRVGGTSDDHVHFHLDVERGQTYKFFADCASARGVKVLYETPATELIQNPITKEILGVKALIEVTPTKDFGYMGGKEIFIKAKKGVILACGGYENNKEILRNFAPLPLSAFVTFYGTPFNTGDGVIMAQRVGAKLWHMNKEECHSFACVPASKALGAGMVVSCWGAAIGSTPGIIVNRDGRRFHNEYHYYGHSNQHRELDEFTDKHMPADDYDYSDYRNVPAYWIFDDVTMKAGPLGRNDRWLATKKVYRWSEDNIAELEKGWIIKGNTLEELGKNIICKDFFGRVVGMNTAGFIETVNRYNQYCAAGKDMDFGRKPKSLLPLNTPPFYAVEICECQTNTQGGPEHNQFRQTLDVDNKPIPRLYSVGELGSIYGFLYTSGGNIPEAYSSGRVAARHAVDLTPWS